ncbi:kelch-like protein 25 [Arctopsyche grandis]|uniref:kelch-like protein 25 n=1 Tax=Arctopsyche grandis TaxID=121162 RepID=UPI00406D82D8
MYDIEAKPDFEKERLEKLHSAAKQHKYIDVEFSVRNRSIFAHMVVLAACNEIFINESVENLNAIFAGYDDAIIDAIFKFCYTGIIYIDEDLYEKFKELATQLQITNLYYKTINLNNCLEALTLSNDPTSIEKAMDLTLENFDTLHKTQNFLRLPVNILVDIIKSDILNVSSETFVLNSVKLWVEEDQNKRKPKLEELLSFVKLPALTMEINFTEIQSGYYSSSEYIKKVNEAIECILKNQTSTNQRWRREKIALVGSYDARDLSTFDVFDSKYKRWTPSRDFDFKRYGFVSVLVDDWILIIGGIDSSDSRETTTTVEYIDLKDNRKHALEPLNLAHISFTAVAIRGDVSTDVYVIGGTAETYSLTKVERWNSKIKNWVNVAPLKRGVYNHSASVIEDKIYVTGGRIAINGIEKAINRVQMYSASTDTWSHRNRMSKKRCDHSSATLNGILYVAGGLIIESVSYLSFLDSVESYNPKANVWTRFSSLPTPRADFSLCSFQNKLLCIGGHNGNFLKLDEVLEYDVRNNNWKPTSSLSARKSGAPLSAFVIPYNSAV